MATPAQVLINSAKISRPKISGTFPRARLHQELDQHKDKPITWITSPPGAGKTTLISHYLEVNKLTTIWYQVDAGDSDLSTFYYYLGQAAKKATPRKRGDMPLLTPAYQEGIPTFTRNFFRGLYARFSKPFAIVFDNYQEVSPDSLLHHMLAIGLQEIPENGKIFIISRAEPPSEFTRFRANGQMVFIDWSYLQISKNEMKGLLSLKGVAITSTDKIMQLTQGWMAGLILLLEQKDIKDWNLGGEKFNPKLLFDYFAGEVFQNTTQEIQDFLIKTALFPKMSLEMATQLSGVKQPGTIFDYLINKNYFTYQHSGNIKLYDYHPLFRSFLLNKFKEQVSDVETTVIKWRAAELLQENKQIEPAVALLAEVGDWQKLARLIIVSAQTLLEQGRHYTLRDWILMVPEPVRENEPWLLYWLGEAYAEYSPEQSWPLHEKGFHLFEQQQDIAGIYLSLAGTSFGIRSQHDGDVRRVDPWLEKLDEIRKKYPDYPSLEVEARVGMVIFMIMWWRYPQHPDMDYWRERVLQIAPKISWGIRARFWVNMIQAFHLLFMGEPEEARYLIETIKSETSDHDIPPLAKCWAHLGHALYLWRAGKYAKCYEEVENGLHVSKETGTTIDDYQLLAIGASAALTTEDMRLATYYIELMKPVEHGVRGSRYHYMYAWYMYALGKLEIAKMHAQKAIEQAEASGVPFFIGLSYSGLASIYIENEELEHARTELSKFMHIIKTTCQSKLFEYIYYCLIALIHFKKGEDKPGIENLKNTLAIGKQRNYIGFAFLSKQNVSYLMTRALQEHIEPEYVHKIIRTMHLKPGPEALSLDNWPWAIEIFGFDHCELKKNGIPVQYSRKFPKKIMQLVGVIVANSGEHVAEEKIIEALWPDAEGDAGHKAFTTTLHRLRKIFDNDAILLHEGRVSFNTDLVWSDVCTFEKILGNMEQVNGSGSTMEKKYLMEKALRLYRGHFLGDSGASWAIPARERLRNKYLTTLEDYGLLLEDENKWQSAIKWYQKGLEMDMLAEQFYQRLMYCYEQMDRRGDAVEIYRQCYRVMVASLGVEPSDKTKAIYNEVRAA